MYGLFCSRCSRPLTIPFSCKVFTDEGISYEVKNKLPEGVEDGEKAVIVYMHGDCRHQGKCSAKILRKRARELRDTWRSKHRRIPESERTVCIAGRLVHLGLDADAPMGNGLKAFPRVRK
jgi:hypothetical protein